MREGFKAVNATKIPKPTKLFLFDIFLLLATIEI